MLTKKNTLLIAIVGSIIFAILMAYAGGSAGQQYGSVSIFAVTVIIAFTINWLAYIPAILAQTEHYYDLIGATTYISVIATASLLSNDLDLRAYIVIAMVIFWAVRLGSYLYFRVKRNGKDGRFDEMKVRPLNFLVAWTMQALWVVMTAACALAIITSQERVPLSLLGIVGTCVWLIGITIEIIADLQKSQFKQDTNNEGKFINTGLWSWSQHPNYLGEIILWVGIAIIAMPILSGLQWFCLLSPVFVFVLLRYISGVNLSHEIGDKRWGDNPDYLQYRKNTPILVFKLAKLFD